MKISAAILSQGIQGAIAEKAVKILDLDPLMAGEIFTFTILEKLVMFHSQALQAML